ncbi:MAG: ATP-binding protein [Pseudomonadota bacterium]
MQEFLSSWGSASGFIPHGHCYLWTPALLWTFVLAEGVIVLSYFSIPLGLMYFVRKRRDFQFNRIFVLFSLFIFACGTTHLMGIWTIWNPDYWLDAAIKAGTAAVSLVTAVLLWPLIPKALKLPSTKQLEDAIRQLQDEVARRTAAEAKLASSNQALKQRSHQLDAANQELQAFAYSVSHDLRAPLRGIDGWSLALAEDYGAQLDEKAREYLRTIRAETQRMGRLIEDLLALSRVTRAEIAVQPVDLSALAQTIAERCRQAAAGRNIDFNIQPGMAATGDAQLLEIALTNLFDNACKFTGTRSDARIEFGCELSEDPQTGSRQTVYFVRDNGVGFDMAHAQRLFGAFQRLHKVSEFPGTGIGLATVQRIMHRHQGGAWADATIGQGATFYFTLTEAA